MRTAQTVLTVIQERGKQHKPIERVYKLLFNRDFYLNAYAKLYPNNGAMTKGVTDETVDGMSIQKIDRMIELLREEKYQWKPARREYIPKKNGKKYLNMTSNLEEHLDDFGFDAQLVKSLVQRIEVSADKRIRIVFGFQDVFADLGKESAGK